MQLAIVEFARHVVGLPEAHSIELMPDTPDPVIHLMADQKGVLDIGGTLRLGAYPCDVMPGSLLEKCYGAQHISERHRHRYEFNNDFRKLLQDAGLVVSGTSPDGYIVETVELPDSPFYVGVQFHPEFKSRPNKPHPLFVSFVRASLELSDNS